MALPATTFQSCPNHPEVNSGLVPCARCGVAYCGDCLVELEGKPYDAACKEEQVRDLRSGTSAPALASAGRRLGGVFVDSLLFVPLWVGLGFAYPKAGLFDHPLPRMVLPGLLIVLYEAWMLAKFGGQTLGKKLCGIRVLKADFSRCGLTAGFLRNLLRIADAFFYHIVALVSLAATFKWQRIGDLVADTVVVKEK